MSFRFLELERIGLQMSSGLVAESETRSVNL